jgi:hypothetical protein
MARYRGATERDPLAHFAGTAPQLALWRCPSKRRLLRTGNQIGGKTTAALVEALWWATHTHPHRETPRRAVQIWVVCVSWTQSLAIQEKLWALAPKRALAATQRPWDPATGFGTKAPVVTFANGSQIHIRTAGQGGLNLAGATIDLIIFDEPPQRIRTLAEVERRLTRTGGDLVLTMTPINADCRKIREMAEKGALTDLHFRGEAENCVTADGILMQTRAGEVMDAAWLAAERAKIVLPVEEPIVIDGEWEMRAEGQVFAAWDASRMWIPSLIDAPIGPRGREVELLVGVDYGDDRLRTAAVLVAVEAGAGPDEPARVWVLGEYVPDRATTIRDDAIGIISMLSALGLGWHHLSGVYGDKRYTDAAGKLTKKSNAMLEAAVSHVLGQAGRKTSPPVKSAKRGEGAGAGALWASIRWLARSMMSDGCFYVDSSCIRVREALEQWDGTDKHPRKDVLDGLRYALRWHWGYKRPAVGVAPRVRNG